MMEEEGREEKEGWKGRREREENRQGGIARKRRVRKGEEGRKKEEIQGDERTRNGKGKLK